MLALASLPLAFNGAAPLVQAPTRAFAPKMETVADLEQMAQDQKVPMGFWDPLGFTKLNLFDMGEAGTIGWLRHAEIKHGRVAMAAFVGFCVQSNGVYFPWNLAGDLPYSELSALPSPGDQWDAVPASGKLQILGTMAFLEVIGERMQPHYTKGGKPGFYPSLVAESDGAGLIPHSVPFDLYDPFGLFKKDSEAKKARGRNVEINNGRAAMLGIFGLISASKGLIVPGLDSVGVAPYGGEPMGFFGPSDALPFVQQMNEGIVNAPWHASGY